MSEQTENTGATTEGAAHVDTPAPKLTRRETLLANYNKLFAKRKDIDEKLTAIVAEVHSIDQLGSVAVGSAVVITVGRGDDAKEVTGNVIAVRDNEDGSKDFKVQYGDGFDANIAVVNSAKIRLPVAKTEEADQPAAE